MKSIRTRLILSFLLVIVIAISLTEVLIINIIKDSYYKSLEASLTNQVRMSAEMYERYFSDSTLYDNVLNNVDTFWKQSTAQVEIIDTNGRVLMDSIGVMPSDVSKMKDVQEALRGNKGTWIGKVDYDVEKVMAVSYPLKSGNDIVGVLRFISSMREVNEDLGKISEIFIFIGIGVILVFAAVSYILAYTIIGPLKEVTATAEKIASGNFKVTSRKRYDDEIGKLSDTLNFMAGEIQKRDRLKNEFISSVSHELRTPLTSIKGWAVTLKEAGPGEREVMAEGLDIIEKECDRLTSMVEELLDFSRFVTGEAALNREEINLKELVLYTYKQLAPRAERDGIQFDVEIDEGLPAVVTDGNRLKQVFINILDNSLKFTAAGGRVNFFAGVNGKNAVFRIKDTGCGIPPDELPRVKEKFFKGRNSKSRNGIGLSICDEIIRLMGGTLEISSEVSKGTEVTVTLPLS